MADINKALNLSIIIPVINEAKRLPLLLADINLYPSKYELIIVDGGSSDSTPLIAKIGGAKVINCSEANRGLQLQQGALIARGKWLLFLHADSRLEKKWATIVFNRIKNISQKRYPYFFNFKVKHKGLIWLGLEAFVFIRSHLLQRPYGDQGLLIDKDLYFKMGGYKAIPIMEDLDLIIRLSKYTRLKGLGIGLKTSTRKIAKGNVIINAIKNAILRYKWSQGESVKKLAKIYYSSKN